MIKRAPSRGRSKSSSTRRATPFSTSVGSRWTRASAHAGGSCSTTPQPIARNGRPSTALAPMRSPRRAAEGQGRDQDLHREGGSKVLRPGRRHVPGGAPAAEPQGWHSRGLHECPAPASAPEVRRPQGRDHPPRGRGGPLHLPAGEGCDGADLEPSHAHDEGSPLLRPQAAPDRREPAPGVRTL